MYQCWPSMLTICFTTFVNVNLVQGAVNTKILCPSWNGQSYSPDPLKSHQCAPCDFSTKCHCCRDTGAITCTYANDITSKMSEATGNYNKLSLYSCSIKEIPSKAFGELKLKVFQTSGLGSEIVVAEDAFSGQEQILEELDIKDKIMYQSPHHFLQNMSNLESLHLSIMAKPRYRSDPLLLKPFSGTKRLKKLHLDFYRGGFKLDAKFLSSFKETLEKFGISGYSSHVETEAALVKTVPSLKSLSLTKDAGTAVWKQIKGQLPTNLQTLKLNQIIENRSDLESLQNTSIEELVIDGQSGYEDIGNAAALPIQVPNQVQVLKIHQFPARGSIKFLLDGEHSKLTQLSIEVYRSINLTMKSEFPNMVSLMLRRFRVTSPFNLNQFPNIENASFEELYTISASAKQKFPNAKIVLSKPLTNLKHLSVLYNTLEITNSTGEDCFAPNLTTFTYIDNNAIFNIDFMANCYNLQSVKYQTYPEEQRDRVLNLDKIPPSVRMLMMAQNRIQYINYTKIDQMLQIEEIDLSYNNLVNLPNIFKFMPNLKHLKLHSNEIAGTISLESVPSSLLTLHLGYNTIQDIIDWNHLTNVNYVNLRNNRLSKIPQFLEKSQIKTTLIKLPKWNTGDTLEDIDLTGNPISCTPEALGWFWCFLTSRKFCLLRFQPDGAGLGFHYEPFYLKKFGSCENGQRRCTILQDIQYCSLNEFRAKETVRVPVTKYLYEHLRHTRC